MVARSSKFESEMLKHPCPELVRMLLEMQSSYLIMIPFVIAGLCHVTVMDVGPLVTVVMLLGSPGTETMKNFDQHTIYSTPNMAYHLHLFLPLDALMSSHLLHLLLLV